MSLKLILLVENDVNLRHSIALILQRAGYLITTTDCVEKALELVCSGRYHLLICDFTISDTPDILLPAVYKTFPNLPVVVLTDQSAAEVENEKKRFTAEFLHKPIAPERLLESVGSSLTKSTRQMNTHMQKVNH